MDNKKSNNGIFIIILLIIVTISVLFFPKLYDLITTVSVPKVQEKVEEKVEEKKEITKDILETIHYPLMRNSIYNPNTYYSLERFTYSNMSNEDILLTAFLDIYEGNMTSYEGVGYCTNVSKQFDKQYIELRIKNIIGNKVDYNLTDFYVPEDSDSNYKGNWNYDGYWGRFLYQGLCNSNATGIKYYNIEELIKTEYENKDIAAYYYVGFATVDGNKYTIYKDPSMSEKLTEGEFINITDLNNVFKSLDKKSKKIYKYLFKNTLCTYSEYCLYEGKWINEL